MQSSINKIAVVGTGVIGTGWIIRFLFNKKKINIYDPSDKQKKFLLAELKRTKSFLKKFYNIALSQREELEYPPFSRLARILILGKKKEDVIKMASLLASKLKFNNTNQRTTRQKPASNIAINPRVRIIRECKIASDIRSSPAY